MADRKADTAAPAKTIRKGENPPFFIALMPKTIMAPTADPMKQAIITPKKFADGIKAMVMASAAFAPAVKPSKPGSASGFRVIPCMIAPDTANAAPTNAAAISRGKRMSRTMETAPPTVSVVSASHTSRTVVSAAPNTIAQINTPINTNILATNLYINGMVCCLLFILLTKEIISKIIQLEIECDWIIKVKFFRVYLQHLIIFHSRNIFIRIRFLEGIVCILVFAEHDIITGKFRKYFC